MDNLLDDTEALMQKGVLAENGSSNFALFLRMCGVPDVWEGYGTGSARDRKFLLVAVYVR